jgi:hypothetical protein
VRAGARKTSTVARRRDLETDITDDRLAAPDAISRSPHVDAISRRHLGTT